MDNNPFIQLGIKYKRRPGQFVRDMWKVTPSEGQEALLMAILVDYERQISVRSGHGTGKTTALAWAMILTLLWEYDPKVVCTAPSQGTLYDGLMAETKKWIHRLPEPLPELFDITGDHIRLKGARDESFISARTSSVDRPEALAGIHAPRVLLVVDEASGVPEAVFRAAVGSMSTSNATTVLIGNPTRTSGLFFDSHHKLKDWWKTFHFSCIGNPNVDPMYIEQIRRQYGEDHNEWRIRVLGEFPIDDGEAFLARNLIEAAMERHMVVSDDTEEVWGLDVARAGGDKVALARRRGPVVPDVRTWAGKDLMQTVGLVMALWNTTPPALRPAEILVDAIGLGAGVADRLLEQNLPIVAVNVTETSGVTGSGYRMRDDLWCRMRDALVQQGICLPNRESLLEELNAPTAEYLSNGKVKIESKKSVRKRLKRSYDEADAVLLTLYSNASPFDAIGAVAGSGYHRDWNPRGKLIRKLNAVV